MLKKKEAVFFTFFLFFLFITQACYARSTPDFVKAHSILLEERERIKVFEDGTYLDSDEIFIKVLDKKGIRQNQVQHFYINRNYSRFEIKLLELIKPDGKKISIDWKKNARFTNPAKSSRMNIFDPNQQVLNVFIPGLSKGDTIHYIIEVNNFKPMITGHFFGRAIFQQPFPVKSIELSISIPKNKELYTLIKNRAKGSQIEFQKYISRNNTVYKWKVKNVPELVPEPSTIPMERVAMRLLFSTLKSWSQVSKWYFDLVEPKLKINDAIKEKVKELISGKKSERDILSAIFFFVAKKIRYMGIIEESKRPGFEPHDVTLTFSRRYGVCRDKAALLVAMLRVAGFKAYPVIIKTGGKLDKEIPVPYFNHAIVAVIPKGDRKIIFLDPTSETSRQFLPDYEQDSSCLLAMPTGSNLILTPVKDPDRNLFFMKIKSTINDFGQFESEIKIVTSQFIDTAFRSILMPRSKDDQERFLKRFLLKRRPDLEIKELKWTNPSDTKRPFEIYYKVYSERFILPTGFIYPISFSKNLGLLDSWLISKGSTLKRKFPLKLKYTFKTVVEEDLELDVDYKSVRLPRFKEIKNRFMDYGTYLSLTKNGLKIRRIFTNRALELPVIFYDDLLSIQEEVLKTQFVPLVLTR